MLIYILTLYLKGRTSRCHGQINRKKNRKTPGRNKKCKGYQAIPELNVNMSEKEILTCRHYPHP